MSTAILPPNSTIINSMILSPQILTNLYTISTNGEFACIANNNAFESISVAIQINDTNNNIFYQNNYIIPAGMSAIIFNNENNYIGYSVFAQTNLSNTSVILATNPAIPSASSLFILIPNLSSYLNISNTSLTNNTSSQAISNLNTVVSNINSELSYQTTNISTISSDLSTVTTTVDTLNSHAFKSLQPISSENITLGNSLRTIIMPNVSSTTTLTIESGTVIGQEVIIFGSNADVVVQSNVTTGTPFFILPDNSEVHSWIIYSSSYAQGIILRWDGNSWRTLTFGRTVISPAVYGNEAVSLNQITGMQSILFDPSNFLPLGNVPLPADASLTQTTPGGYFNYNGEIYEVPTHIKTYSAGTDTYEYVDSIGNITYLEVTSGSPEPAAPTGTVPFQKVSTTTLSTPSAPMGVIGTATSSIVAGTYDYQIVAINASGNSLPSPIFSLAIPANGSADLAWRLVPYQTTTQIYRDGYLLTTVTGQTYTDTATSTTNEALPTANTSNFIDICTPLYNVIDTRNNKTINLSLFGKFEGVDITALLLGCLNYASSIYKSSDYNTEYGSQPSYLMNAVRVIIPDGQNFISQPITVPPGITLDFDGLLTNNLLDIFTPCITWGIGSFSNIIQINANGSSGVQLGTYSTQNNIRFGAVRIASAGQAYNSILGLSQIGVYLSGYNITINTIQVDTANVGLSLLNASDVRISRCISVGCSTGFALSGCEQVSIDFIDVDSPQYLAATIDSSHDITINGTLWINGIGYGGSANTRNFLQVGAYSSAQALAGINLKFNLLNCGIIPVSVANIDQSRIDVVVGAGNLFTGVNYPPQSVISYGSGVGNGFLLTGTAVIPTTSNWANGTTPAGSYNIFTNGTSVKDIISTTLSGSTAGTINYTMPFQGTYKKFIAYFNGYENDTTTNQTITFQTPFINSPMIVVNQTGLTITLTTTTLTITAPNTTTIYTGYVTVEGI